MKDIKVIKEELQTFGKKHNACGRFKNNNVMRKHFCKDIRILNVHGKGLNL